MTNLHKNPETQQEKDQNQIHISLDGHEAVNTMMAISKALNLINMYADNQKSYQHLNLISYLMEINNHIAEALDQKAMDLTLKNIE